ncbi:MAG: ABC transporter permease [Acidobacteriota bacterium]|nr:MAG: ABC transporter permease [Acidobacteriota bacterium]
MLSKKSDAAEGLRNTSMLSTILKRRHLLNELVWRDVRSRYIGSILGMFWSVLNPLCQLALYTIIFSAVLKIRFGPDDSTGRFAQLVFCALLPWTALQESTIRSARGFIEHSNLIKKVRFPLETIPLSYVFSAIIHQVLGFLAFFLILLVIGTLDLSAIYLLPLLFFVQIMLMYGWGLIIGSLNVFFRDISQVIGILFMFLFWMTPIVYPKTRAPDFFQLLLNLNPLTHMVEAYRHVVFGTPSPSVFGLTYLAVFALVSLVTGHTVLNRTRKDLVDLI